MGLFPFAATISSILKPLRASGMRSRWPEIPWRGCAWYTYQHQSKTSDDPFRPSSLRPLSPARAINSLSFDRAYQSIQRTSLTRRQSRTGTALRRWMLPTVERGPPATICV
jgi:hypothetical protein